MKINLKKPKHYLKIYQSAPYQTTAEVWKNDFIFPIYENQFRQSATYQEMVNWGNNVLTTKANE